MSRAVLNLFASLFAYGMDGRGRRRTTNPNNRA